MELKGNKREYNKMNILLCLDDTSGDYTRHCAVTILSLLETNKNNKIKIWIMSSCLPEENIAELRRIVALYNQEIEFIIRDDIVPEELKKVIINRRGAIWGPRYRYFFSNFIKGIEKILYIDCDVLVMGDLSEIYNMNMHGKAIAGYLDCFPYRCKNVVFHLKNYINSGVLLFDVKKYDVKKINVNNMEEINKKYSEYFLGWDQDKANIIFKDDIFVYNESMNYQLVGKYFNKGLSDAKIIHCLQKPYICIQRSNLPRKVIKLYNHYLSLTKWSGYPVKKTNQWCLKYILDIVYSHVKFFHLNFLIYLLGEKRMEKLISFMWKLEDYKSLKFKG